MTNARQLIQLGTWTNIAVVLLLLVVACTGFLAYGAMLKWIAAERQIESGVGGAGATVPSEESSGASESSRKELAASRLLHYWVAQLLELAIIGTVIVWIVACMVIADVRRKWFGVGLRILVGVVLVVVLLHTNFTGYLGPSGSPYMSRADLVRFKVIHPVFEPFLLAMLLAWWWILCRRLARVSISK
jgi:hypothetical protein